MPDCGLAEFWSAKLQFVLCKTFIHSALPVGHKRRSHAALFPGISMSPAPMMPLRDASARPLLGKPQRQLWG